MANTKTPLGLNQWELDEKLKMADFNADNQIVDEKLRGLDDELGVLTEQVIDIDDRVATLSDLVFIDATATYAGGVFELHGAPVQLPDLYTVRFIAPVDYTYGDRIQVGGLAMNIATPDGGAPQTGAFKAGTMVSMDVHGAGGRAFFKQGGGSATGYGILPSQTQIDVTPGDAQAQVTLSNPGGEAFAGTKLVCKQGSVMPQTQTDGAIFDAAKNTSYTITGLANDTVHTVRAFAYNQDGEVQTDINGAVKTVTPVAYAAPGNVSGLSATAGASQVTIKWIDPGDGARAVWAGTKLVRKQGGYPFGEADGSLLVDSKTRNRYAANGFVDTGLQNGTTYCYQAFPYSDMGMVNRDSANRASATTLTGMPLSDLPVGALVNITVSGAAKPFLVVHQGRPSAMYDESFAGGTILLMRDIYEERQWHSANVNDYNNSAIHSYLNNEFLTLIDEKIRAAMIQVKIPYRPGSSGTAINSCANGLTAYVWLLSSYEVNWTTSTNRYFAVDGATLSYFAGTEITDVKRVANLNGTAAAWWIRTPNTGGKISGFCVANSGANVSVSCIASAGVRPALVLLDTTYVYAQPNPDGSYNLML